MSVLKVKVGNEWFAALRLGGSSGGVGNVVDIPPKNPHAMNDEFEGDALDPKWTKQLGMDYVPQVVVANGRLTIKDVFIRPISQPTPVGEWEFTCKFVLPPYVEQYANFGMVFSNDTDNYIRSFNLNWGNADLICFTLSKQDATYQGNFLGARGLFQIEQLYMRMKRYLNNGVMWISMQVSRDGVYYTEYSTMPETDLLQNGVGRIGIYGSNQNPARATFAAEWFRKTA